jgi:hypothetical protein
MDEFAFEIALPARRFRPLAAEEREEDETQGCRLSE